MSRHGWVVAVVAASVLQNSEYVCYEWLLLFVLLDGNNNNVTGS
jgi:hypothetical protein